jgi:hypothetical protein
MNLKTGSKHTKVAPQILLVDMAIFDFAQIEVTKIIAY